jgi:hypothetical protein
MDTISKALYFLNVIRAGDNRDTSTPAGEAEFAA